VSNEGYQPFEQDRALASRFRSCALPFFLPGQPVPGWES